MKIFKDTLDAVIYVRESKLPYSSKKIKIEHLKSIGIAKINNEVLIVDEYNVLND